MPGFLTGALSTQKKTETIRQTCSPHVTDTKLLWDKEELKLGQTEATCLSPGAECPHTRPQRVLQSAEAAASLVCDEQ